MEEKLLQRVVKMQFRADAVDLFLQHFNEVADEIRYFPGCEGLRLLQDTDNSNILFTYSHWRDASALDHYRNSELFRSTWKYVRTLFEVR
ncbi:MAG TPA: antibiotic biosynthesis monooxygenase, partial [Saprospiraceae bacterium]|nr:antibiotic biosynthesis monooxygenase [Saprospiraceae bacterium]